ncbi:hypothetical protein EKH77_24255 [Streptomyces luteoverticillatus]|uniref:Uncharacterized protein n=1 Tax=Streptomyces luteoverticillatus TaxID=66425 RepID=A0A3S9PNF5_STRLT|nr:hypothetical protein EKH77_24255 [Streptomyces luteoverticillatus]
MVVQRTEAGLRRTLVGSTPANARPDGSGDERGVGAEELTTVLKNEFRIALGAGGAAILTRVYRVAT